MWNENMVDRLCYISIRCSVQFSRSVVSDSLRPHRLQHARPPCPSPTPGVYPNSCPLSLWCHPTVSSSVVPFFSRLQSFPAPGSFPMTQFFASDGQSTGVSASASVLPMNIQNWFPFRMDWLNLLSVQGTVKSLFQHHSSKASILWCSAFFIVQLSHQYMITGKTIPSIEWVMLYNDLILCHPLFLFPSIFPSIRVFSSESAPHIRWPKYWSFSFHISPSNEYSGLISFRMEL